MASNQTSNFQLSQWEANDEVLRADFNEDNLKIDTALTAVKAVTDVAFTPENSPIVIGIYTGDGAATRVISLGFTPKAVYLCRYDGATHTRGTSNGYYGGLALPGHNVSVDIFGIQSWVAGKSVLGIVENGFQVSYVANSSLFCLTNEKDSDYRYLALK